uniref:NADH-ubiquinone oxidoreductase chain 5 n=1 Tax=Planorbarius corneus TaxID=240818 RepID=A0A7M4C8S4_9GAST|nr:NADH dehydrogenase subunit 5 [Planorbarius corneus]
MFSLSIFFSMFLMYFIYCNETKILEINMVSIFSCEFIFSLVLDKVSLMFGVVVTLISGSVFLFACSYMQEDPFFYRFMWILLSFVLSMCFLIFSGSLLFMLMGWDGLGVTSFALIIYYQSKDSLTAGFQTLMINRIGDVFIVISFFLFVYLGQFSYSYALTNSALTLMFLLSMAALTKSAQYPFSSWLPAAMAAPTPVSALVHSSTLVTAGIYLIIRMSMLVELSFEISSILLFTGSITCLLGGTAAIYEFDLKKIVALSTLSQLGLMVFALGMGFPNLALFHLFTHALFKALLFLAAGAILMSSFGTQDLRMLGSVGNSVPFCTMIFNVSSLCLVGAPFLSAFYSKHMILEKMMFNSMNLFSIIFISVATITTAMYTTRMLKSLVWTKPCMTLISKSNDFSVYLPMIILALSAIMGGKIIANIESWFLEMVFIPNAMSVFINLLAIVGVFMGLLMNFKSNSFFWSTMFFLTPMYNSSGKFMTPILKNMSSLDYGWLEMGPK